MSEQRERCVRCGEVVAAGSPLYSDRQVLEREGQRAYLCSLCTSELLVSAHPRRRPMSEEEREKLERAAFAFGAFAPGGH
ncbi:MAG TPA: hypothetical protein VF770_03625 [Solirubrobacterales bacterium]